APALEPLEAGGGRRRVVREERCRQLRELDRVLGLEGGPAALDLVDSLAASRQRDLDLGQGGRDLARVGLARGLVGCARLELCGELGCPPLDLVDARTRRSAQALCRERSGPRSLERGARRSVLGLSLRGQPERALGARLRTYGRVPSALGIRRMPLGALGKRRHAGGAGARLV